MSGSVCAANTQACVANVRGIQSDKRSDSQIRRIGATVSSGERLR